MTGGLRRTPLHDEHVALGAKMVPFAGFEMPVHYPTGIIAEHSAVRSKAGLFDVSHMGELTVRGPDALRFVGHLCANDASLLAVGGGVVDDLIVYRFEDRYMLVVNASNLEKDSTWILRHALEFDVVVEDVSDRMALIALQGPRAREILLDLTALDVDALRSFRFAEGTVGGVSAVVSRTGYTGEDGAELYVASDDAVSLWRALLDAGAERGLVPAGLGCRDSLRTEMGYPLYGNELDEEHTPLESGLGWVVKLDRGPFLGRDVLVAQRDTGVARRLVGLRMETRAFPRKGYAIVSDGQVVGRVTSGLLSPSLGEGVAMGYVPSGLAESGTPVQVDVRGRAIGATVVSRPFYRRDASRRP